MCKNLWMSILLLGVGISTVFAASWQPVEGRIMTKWDGQVNPDNPLPEYPRPTMVREVWNNLNGLWDYTIVHKDAAKIEYWDGKILVPFPVESALSGIAKRVGAEKALWYRRNFTIQDEWANKRILLHFGAVDWECTVWINGNQVGSHKGGFDPFSFDITDALKTEGEQDITIRVWDPTNYQNNPIPRGKQVVEPEGIWYTPVTGIWQTVWMEPVPKASIRGIKVTPDIDRKQVTIEVDATGKTKTPSFKAMTSTVNCQASDNTLILKIDDLKLWSPDDPFLYDLTVQLLDGGKVVDEVGSYFGMRKIEVKKDDEGINRLFLNNQPLFQFGPLDQGWWPDGLYTAPSDQALRYDVEMTKKWGFNMLRKHVKTEPQRLYYWCDKLGVLVWQDMPSSGFDRDAYSADQLRQFDAQWEAEWKAIIDALYHHPSIVMWVPFNEGWGQYDTERITAWTKQYDPSRLVNNASGWTDKRVGDVHDIHVYPGPGMPPLEEKRASVLGEFGGLGLPLKDHLWQVGASNWGYRTYQQKEVFENRYIDLIRKIYRLVDKGLAAAVYTQTTDVEVEVNGLMTYDRKVIKLDPERFASVNQGYVPPFFKSDRAMFIDSIEVQMVGWKNPQIRYTLDGSEPTQSSALYSKPITLTKPATVKTRCFWKNGKTSPVASRTYRKVDRVSPAIDTDVQNAGLKFVAYQGQWSSMPDFDSMTAKKSGVAKKVDASYAGFEEYFGMQFTGYINIPTTGVYQLSLISDDGSKLFLDGEELIDNDGLHGVEEVKAEVALEAGWHPIKVEFFQGGGGYEVGLHWEGPGFGKTSVKADALGH